MSKKGFFIDKLSNLPVEEYPKILNKTLKTSDVDLKRRTKNEFINYDSIKQSFNQLKNELNTDQSNDNLVYLVKGSSAWYANFLEESKNEDIQDMRQELSGNIAFLPQNWDIEIYCPEDKIDYVIPNYYLILQEYKDKYRGDTGKSKRITRKSAIEKRLELNLPEIETCISASKNIILGADGKMTLDEKVGMENFKAYSLSFCVKLKQQEFDKFSSEDSKNIESAWEKYSDDGTCTCDGGSNFHFIFYITFHEIPNNLWDHFKTNYYRHITTTINTVNYLNLYGLLYYANILRASVSTGFRTEKGMDIDNFRIEKLYDVLTKTKETQLRKQKIIKEQYELYNFVNIFFNNNIDIWNQYLLPSKYWLKNLNQTITKKMLESHSTQTVPNGIVQRLDDIIIDFYRPIINSIIIELNIKLNSDNEDFKLNFPKWTVKIMIAGGDAFERYIPTGKIADIDLKVIIKYNEKSRPNAKSKTDILNYVRTKIFAILSKHVCLLNKMVDACHNDDIVFQNAVAQSSEFYSIGCRENKAVFKICPIYNEKGEEIKSTFRLRNNYVKKSNGEFSFNLISIDYRKKFNVSYNQQNFSYSYDLAILDVPFKFYEEFDYVNDIELQDTYSKSVVDETCYEEKKQEEDIIMEPSEIVKPTKKYIPKPLKQEYINPIYGPYKQKYEKSRYHPYRRNFGFQQDGEKIENDDMKLPMASKIFLIKDQRYIYNDNNLLQSRFFSGKIGKDLIRYKQLNNVLDDEKIPSTSTLEHLNKVDLNYFNFSVTNMNNIPINLKKNILGYFIEILIRFALNKDKAKVKRNFVYNLNWDNNDIIDTINSTIIPEYDFNELSLMKTVSEEDFVDFINLKVQSPKQIKVKKGFFFSSAEDEDEEDFEPDFINIDDSELLI